MTGISLLPFYSEDATTKLAWTLLYRKGKHSFLSCQTDEMESQSPFFPSYLIEGMGYVSPLQSVY